jgi:hypothetical protein
VVQKYGSEGSVSCLFGIARAKDALVADKMEILGSYTQWNVSFVREAHD